MKAYKQYFLFKSVRTDRGRISLKEEPFPHLEVVYGKTCLMFPLEELIKAKRMIDGLTLSERKIIKKMFCGFTTLSREHPHIPCTHEDRR